MSKTVKKCSLCGTNIKHGKGMQIWPDGSIYEGWFKNNHAHGVGRFINTMGIIYEGDWIEDRIEGIGISKVHGGLCY